MEYMEFLDEVRDYINEESDNITVHVHSALKNNGVKLAGLSFAGLRGFHLPRKDVMRLLQSIWRIIIQDT